jgi:hypothetical protein
MRERLIEIGWRWVYEGAPSNTRHKYSPVYEGRPESHAIAAAQNSSFAPVKVQKVYVLEELD